MEESTRASPDYISSQDDCSLRLSCMAPKTKNVVIRKGSCSFT